MDTYSKTYLLLFNAIMSCVDRQSKQTRAWLGEHETAAPLPCLSFSPSVSSRVSSPPPPPPPPPFLSLAPPMRHHGQFTPPSCARWCNGVQRRRRRAADIRLWRDGNWETGCGTIYDPPSRDREEERKYQWTV